MGTATLLDDNFGGVIREGGSGRHRHVPVWELRVLGQINKTRRVSFFFSSSSCSSSGILYVEITIMPQTRESTRAATLRSKLDSTPSPTIETIEPRAPRRPPARATKRPITVFSSDDSIDPLQQSPLSPRHYPSPMRKFRQSSSSYGSTTDVSTTSVESVGTTTSCMKYPHEETCH